MLTLEEEKEPAVEEAGETVEEAHEEDAASHQPDRENVCDESDSDSYYSDVGYESWDEQDFQENARKIAHFSADVWDNLNIWS